MTEPAFSVHEFEKLTQKRVALEGLIRITVSIQSQQQSLIELSAIARPSQKFPAKLVKHVKQLSLRLGELAVAELIQRLESVESAMSKGLKKILILAKVDANRLRDLQLENLSIDGFVEVIENFKRRTQTAVALRFILKDRGVAIAPFPLVNQQESIKEEVESLKVKEKKCTVQVRQEIETIAKASDEMMKMPGLPDEIKQQVNQVGQAMRVNLEHLDNGGNVADIPNVFETIVLETPGVEPKAIKETGEAKEKKKLTNKKQAAKKRSSETADKSSNLAQLGQKKKINSLTFWRRLNLWFSSPWSVSWKSLKEGAKDSKKKKQQ